MLCACRRVRTFSVVKLEGKSLLERNSGSWNDDIKM